jgi:hypothetical protein
MPNLTLLSDASPAHLAAEITVSGLDLIPAGVAALVLTALGTALVITALRRREAEREEALRTFPRAESVDA